MRAVIRLPLIGLFLFCTVQLLALYVWLPHTFIKSSIPSRCCPAQNETNLDNLGNLESCIIRLVYLARRRGLSDRDLMVLLLQALGSTSQEEAKPNVREKLPSSIVQVYNISNESRHKDTVAEETFAGKLSIAVEPGQIFQVLTDNDDIQKKNEKVDTKQIAHAVKEKQAGKVGLKKEEAKVDDTKLEIHTEPKNVANKSNDINKKDPHRQLSDQHQWNNISNPVNPHNYNLVINQPYFCQPSGSQLEVFLLIVMISSPKAFKQRDIQRNSSLSVSQVSGKIIRSIFLLGDSGDQTVTSKVRNEADKYGDILMEDFHDSYRNLTLKTLMGLKWASLYCPKAKYVLKTDDDVFLELTNLIHLLEGAPRQSFMTGFVYKGTKPIRDKRSKWYISEEAYPRDIYPPYCCGIGYVISGDLPGKILEMSFKIPYIFLEDAYVGLCIEKLNVVPTVNPGFFTYREEYSYCKFKGAYVVHLKRPPQIAFIFFPGSVDRGVCIWR
ncbi:beta-1,3-galactosyltransferase 1-like [Apostichopus japonicus]|uniref:beta-1,3-galactosyltransferase 1-like n=1 Tax=Stichopus japonicus TaxID=307972 RepID=UPI003AB16EB1